MIKVRILTLLELNSVSGVVVILLSTSLFLTACSGFSVDAEKNVVWEKSKMYEVKGCTIGRSCFFQYPVNAGIVDKDNSVTISDQGCSVKFGNNAPAGKPTYVISNSESYGRNVESWTYNDVLVGYFVSFPEVEAYKFWLYKDENDVKDCVPFIDEIAGSFTAKPIYNNEKFGFKTAVLSDYRVEYLPEDEGMTMRRTVDGEELKKIYDGELGTWPSSAKHGPDETPYEVIIAITAMENLLGYKDLGAYLKAECADCTLDFFGDGVFVGEDKINFSERVYIAMSEDKKTLYRAFLRLPRHRFRYHQKGFDEWVKTIELF